YGQDPATLIATAVIGWHRTRNWKTAQPSRDPVRAVDMRPAAHGRQAVKRQALTRQSPAPEPRIAGRQRPATTKASAPFRSQPLSARCGHDESWPRIFPGLQYRSRPEREPAPERPLTCACVERTTGLEPATPSLARLLAEPVTCANAGLF